MIRKSYLFVALAGIATTTATAANATRIEASTDEGQQTDTLLGSYSTVPEGPERNQNAPTFPNQPSAPNYDSFGTTRPHLNKPRPNPKPNPSPNPNPNPKPNPSPKPNPNPNPTPKPNPDRPTPERPSPDKPSSAAPVTLNSAREVVDALRSGYSVNVDVDINKCTAPDVGEKTGLSRFGSRIDGYAVSSDGSVNFSRLWYSNESKGPEILVRHLTDYAVNTDGTVTIQVDAFNALGYRKGKSITHTCRIGKGVLFKAE